MEEDFMIASIIHDNNICYPDGKECYSPSEHYPEYPFTHIATRPNLVYQAVRNCLAQAELDKENFGTPAWDPLGKFIKKGDKVFILCNFVYHRKPREPLKDFFGKCTHASILRSLIDYVYISTGSTGIISFGNAPLQSCSWEQVLKDTDASILPEFYKNNNVKVSAKDLRLQINERNLLGNISFSKMESNAKYTLVELDEKSILNDLYSGNEKIKFRVSDYNPNMTESFHGYKNHKYIINNDILSSDVIISVPKLKTHEKVGITIGLKGFVGCVGSKDCLAHHRFGPPILKGDEYPDNGRLQIILSKFHDFVYKRNYPRFISPLLEIIDINFRRIFRKIFKKIQVGAWYGNDTTWRMVIDLAHIMYFADRNGEMADEIQRKHIVLIDGVVGGEGNGPLSPSPVESKTVIFSDNIVCGDIIACKVMGYDPKKIPLLHYSMQDYSLFNLLLSQKVNCILNWEKVDCDNVDAILGRSFNPPDGWKGYLL